MQIRLPKSALTAFLALASFAPAPAATIVSLQDGAGTVATVVNNPGSPAPFPGTSGTFSGNVGPTGVVATGGDFTIVTQSAQETVAFVGGMSELFASTTSVTNISGSTETLHVIISGTGFTSPVAGELASHIGGTAPLTFSGSNSLTFASFANPSNNATPGGTTPGPQVVSLTAPTSFASDASVGVVGLPAGGFSLLETIDVSLAAGAQINFSSSTILSPVPEPTTLLMWGLGLPVVGIGVWMQRRARRVV